MTDGLRVFSRFAFPPNSLGYCGPEDPRLLGELVAADPASAREEMVHVAQAFAGAWPYLTLIATQTGRTQLDPLVVEAYWIGNPLLDNIDIADWGRSLDDRFARRAGSSMTAIDEAIARGGKPTHAFHVFCIYPWVGLLRDGAADPALHVLDRCRVRWGRVLSTEESVTRVETRHLTWDGSTLGLGPIVNEEVRNSVDPGLVVDRGDVVAMHWDYITARLSAGQLHRLTREHDEHLGLVNRQSRELETTLTG